MNIPDAVACANFIQANGLQSLCPEAGALINCLNEAARLCGGCGNGPEAEAKRKSCIQLYIIFAGKAPAFKGQLFARTAENVINFYDGGRYLNSVTR